MSFRGASVLASVAVIVAAFLASSPIVFADRHDLASITTPKYHSVVERMTQKAGSIDQMDPSEAAYRCLGVTSVIPGMAVGIADKAGARLVQTTMAMEGNPSGWGLSRNRFPNGCAGPGTESFFGAGKCNGPETSYAFQTALGIKCLARASFLTSNAMYAVMAKKISQYWILHHSTSKIPGCTDCIYFWYSDNINDRDRYVRNTNVLLASAVYELGQVLGDSELKNVGHAVYHTEVWERAQHNFGYLGALDPSFKKNPQAESQRIENHYPTIAKALLDIGSGDENPEVIAFALDVYYVWRNCDNSGCIRGGCSYWSGDASVCSNSQAASSCFFFHVDPRARAECLQVIDRLAVPSDYQFWTMDVFWQRK